MKKFGILLLLAVVLLVGGFIINWFLLSPSITPDDIKLSGVVKKNENSPEPKLPTKEGYVIEITFDKITEKPLFVSDKDYFFCQIFPYVKGFTNEGWDFFLGLDERGQVKGAEGYYFGIDSRTIRIASAEVSDLEEGFGEQDGLLGENPLGFSYIGEDFPTRVRIYLSPVDKPLDTTEAYLIYSHYEMKWGKDLSWAKAIPLEIDD